MLRGPIVARVWLVLAALATILTVAGSASAGPTSPLRTRYLGLNRQVEWSGGLPVSRVVGTGDARGQAILQRLLRRGWLQEGNVLSKGDQTMLLVDAPHAGARDLSVLRMYEYGRTKFDIPALSEYAGELARYRAGGFREDAPLRAELMQLLNEVRMGVVIGREDGLSNSALSVVAYGKRWITMNPEKRIASPVDTMLHEFGHTLEVGPGANGDKRWGHSLRGNQRNSTDEGWLLSEWMAFYFETSKPGMSMGEAYLTGFEVMNSANRYGSLVSRVRQPGEAPLDLLGRLFDNAGLSPGFPEMYLHNTNRPQ